MSSRIRGVVKSFKKGYGFIIGPDGSDVFVHYSFIEEMEGFRTLRQGQEVEYELAQTDRGLQAHHVVAVSTPEE